MMVTRCTKDDKDNLTIPAELADRWMTLCNTPYEKLPEESKQADRDEVMRYWPLIHAYMANAEKRAFKRGELASVEVLLDQAIAFNRSPGEFYNVPNYFIEQMAARAGRLKSNLDPQPAELSAEKE